MPETPPPRRTLDDLLGGTAAGLIVTLFCFLLLRHDSNFFWYDDYQISILPVFADIARSWSEGNWPLLSPYSWACSNLAGEFQYGTFSIFVNAAVIAIWRFNLDFAQQAAALSIVHLFALAAGGYMLARGRDLSAPLALMVALVTALNGWMICWGASDWFGALAAVRVAAVGVVGARARDASGASAVQRARRRFLHLPRGDRRLSYTVLMLGLVTAWLGLRSLVARRDWLASIRLGLGWLLGLGLSAPAWIALLDYAPGSRRAVEVFPSASMDGAVQRITGIYPAVMDGRWPLFGETIEPHVAIELACGLVPLVSVIAAIAMRGRRSSRSWVGVRAARGGAWDHA
jgi:hypothetical protein